MKDRLSRIFNPQKRQTVMLAFDHGYIMGPTAGLERPDLAPAACGIRRCADGHQRRYPHLCAAHLQQSYRSALHHRHISIARRPQLRTHRRGRGRRAIRLNASCIVVQTFVAQKRSRQLQKPHCNDRRRRASSIPVMGVTAVGKRWNAPKILPTRHQNTRRAGAHIIKTYYCEGFEEVTAVSPCAHRHRRRQKLPERDVSAMARKAIDEGAAGVDMGTNFQAETPRRCCAWYGLSFTAALP